MKKLLLLALLAVALALTGCGGSPAARGPNTSEALAGLAVLTQDECPASPAAAAFDRATGGA